jgi:hypothetical protein
MRERVLSRELIVPAAPVKAVLLDGIDPGSVHDHDQVDADAAYSARLSGPWPTREGSWAVEVARQHRSP